MSKKIERSYKKKKIVDSSFVGKEKRKEKLHEVKNPREAVAERKDSL